MTAFSIRLSIIAYTPLTLRELPWMGVMINPLLVKLKPDGGTRISDNRTTLWYELCKLIKPQSYIIVLLQLYTI